MSAVFDTNALVLCLAGRAPKSLLADGVIVSVITELECLAYPSLTAQEEVIVRSVLTKSRVVELIPAVKDQAIRIRRAHR